MCSAPITRRTRCEEKDKPYPATPSGMPGVQTLVPVMLDHVNEGRLTLERFVDLTSAGPQRIFGIAGKGRIARRLRRRPHDRRPEGASASSTITGSPANAGWTPFAGLKVKGWPVGTVVRGRLAMWEGEVGQAAGEPVRFGEALPKSY